MSQGPEDPRKGVVARARATPDYNMDDQKNRSQSKICIASQWSKIEEKKPRAEDSSRPFAFLPFDYFQHFLRNWSGRSFLGKVEDTAIVLQTSIRVRISWNEREQMHIGCSPVRFRLRCGSWTFSNWLGRSGRIALQSRHQTMTTTQSKYCLFKVMRKSPD